MLHSDYSLVRQLGSGQRYGVPRDFHQRLHVGHGDGPGGQDPSGRGHGGLRRRRLHLQTPQEPGHHRHEAPGNGGSGEKLWIGFGSLFLEGNLKISKSFARHKKLNVLDTTLNKPMDFVVS